MSGTNRGGPNAHKNKTGTKDTNGKVKFNKLIQNNNAWNKLKPKFMALVKATATKAKEEAENYYEMNDQICEALIIFINVNNPPKANVGPKNDAMVLANETLSHYQES